MNAINGYQILNSATHPETGEIYSVGDRICIYQGRFGHNNIWIINSIFKYEDMIYVSEQSYTEKDYKRNFPDNPTGTYLDAVKGKISDKEYRNIQNVLNKYS